MDRIVQMVSYKRVLSHIGALQRAGARIESITVHPLDAELLKAELAANPQTREGDVLDNALARVVFKDGHKAFMWLHGYPVYTDESLVRGTISVVWSEA